MQKIEHIGIAVKNLQSSNDLYKQILGIEHYKLEAVPAESVITSFFKVGENKIELIESADPNGVISKFIEKKGEGIHHIAFSVQDIFEEMERLRNAGFLLLSEQPKLGADNKLVFFVHPKNTNGVLVELCQEIIKR